MSAALLSLPLLFAAAAWQPMFDGKTLEGWRETPFRNHGAATVDNGAIVLSAGAPLTGVNFSGEFPRDNYEVRFEAARRKGSDFFASLTFPIGETFATFVTGGWGGDIIGISSIDGWDASDNETRAYFTFERDRWYAFRLRVSKGQIGVWIDNKQVVDVDVNGRTVDLRRGDIKLSAPFGFASYNTTGAIRKIEYQRLN